MIKIAWYTLIILTTLTVLVILWQFSTAVVMFLLSLALAAAFQPIMESLTTYGVKKGLALVIIYGAFFIITSALLVVGYRPLMKDLQNATDLLVSRYEWLKNLWLQSNNTFLVNIGGQMPDTKLIYSKITGDGSNAVLGTILGIAQGTFAFLAKIAMIIALSMYWSADHIRFERLWLSLLSVNVRQRARQIWQAVEEGVGRYIRREATLSLIIGLLLWVGYLLLDVKYPTLLALIAAIARVIPWLGPLLVITLPIIVGSGYGWWAGVLTAGFSLMVFILVEGKLGKRIFPAQRVSSIFLVIVVVVLADSFGLMGAILATVLSVTLQILLSNLFMHSVETLSVSNEPSLNELMQKIYELQQKISDLDEKRKIEAFSLVGRLEGIIKKAKTYQ